MPAQAIFCIMGIALLDLGLLALTGNVFASAFISLSVGLFVCCICKEIYDSKK